MVVVRLISPLSMASKEVFVALRLFVVFALPTMNDIFIVVSFPFCWVSYIGAEMCLRVHVVCFLGLTTHDNATGLSFY